MPTPPPHPDGRAGLAQSDALVRARLRHDPDVLKFLAGRVAGEVGSRITREGLPIVAILATGASAQQLGVLGALSMLPALLIGQLAGHVVDRRRRRPVMVASELIRAAVLATIPIAALVHRLTFVQIAVVTVLVAMLQIAYRVADRGYLPFLVGRDRLEPGNQLMGGADAVGEASGPALMGVLIQTVGGPAAILFDAVSRVLSAVGLLAVRRVEPPPVPVAPASTEASGFGAGLTIVRRHPQLKWLAYNRVTESFFSGCFTALYELYALTTLHLTPLDLGLLITSGGIGSFVASLWVARWRRRLGLGGVLVATFALGAATHFLVPLAQGPVVVAFGLLFIAQFVGDLFLTMFEIEATVLEQTVTPDHWLGRVEGALQMLNGGAGVVGAVLSGSIAVAIGMRETFWMFTAGGMLAAVWLLHPSIRRVGEAVLDPAWFQR